MGCCPLMGGWVERFASCTILFSFPRKVCPHLQRQFTVSALLVSRYAPFVNNALLPRSSSSSSYCHFVYSEGMV